MAWYKFPISYKSLFIILCLLHLIRSSLGTNVIYSSCIRIYLFGVIGRWIKRSKIQALFKLDHRTIIWANNNRIYGSLGLDVIPCIWLWPQLDAPLTHHKHRQISSQSSLENVSFILLYLVCWCIYEDIVTTGETTRASMCKRKYLCKDNLWQVLQKNQALP